jgi:AcrR family transcriptional regulator
MADAKTLTPKQEDRRHRILSATRAIVASQGYDQMVMSDVAEAAGVSPTTLYNLYNTKDELLLESLRDLLVDNYTKIGNAHQESGWKYLLGVVKNGAWLRKSEPTYAEAITDALLRAGPGDALSVLLLDNIQQDFHHSLRVMKKNGELREDIDLKQLADLILGNYWSTYILANKAVITDSELDIHLQTNILSILIAATVPETKVILEQTLAEIRRQETNNE